MKIAINIDINEIGSTSSGGVVFARGLIERAASQNIDIRYDLSEENLDAALILNITDLQSFTIFDFFWKYRSEPKRPLLIFRANDSGLHRSSPQMYFSQILGLFASDLNIFISKWLQVGLCESKFGVMLKLKEKAAFVIWNPVWFGVECPIRERMLRQKKQFKKIQIVTHHWSSNGLKGDAVYLQLARHIENGRLSNVQFTFIGNPSQNIIECPDVKCLPPMKRRELQNHLMQSDLYLTGSKWEAGGMHAIEAYSIGIPVVYLKSGGVGEYLNGAPGAFGFVEENEDLERALDEAFAYIRGNSDSGKHDQQVYAEKHFSSSNYDRYLRVLQGHVSSSTELNRGLLSGILLKMLNSILARRILERLMRGYHISYFFWKRSNG